MTTMAHAQNLYGAPVGNIANMANVGDYQIRQTALNMAAGLVGNSTSSPEILIDAAKKIEAYLRGEDNKN